MLAAKSNNNTSNNSNDKVSLRRTKSFLKTKQLTKQNITKILKDPTHVLTKKYLDFVNNVTLHYNVQNLQNKHCPNGCDTDSIVQDLLPQTLKQCINDFHAFIKNLSGYTLEKYIKHDFASLLMQRLDTNSAKTVVLNIVYKRISDQIYNVLMDLIQSQTEIERINTDINNKIAELHRMYKDSTDNKQLCSILGVSETYIQNLVGSDGTFKQCVLKLQKLPQKKTIDSKYKILTKVLQCICAMNTIDTDTLINSIVFIFVHSNMQNVYLEFKFLEQLSDKTVFRGMEGYLLATFQTCILFVQQLSYDRLRNTTQDSTKIEKATVQPMQEK